MAFDRVVVVVDIDGTMMISKSEQEQSQEKDKVDFERHKRGEEWIVYDDKDYTPPIEFLLINPEKLSALFNFVLSRNIEVIILTAGSWKEQQIKEILCRYLSIEKAYHDALLDCHFLSPQSTCYHFPDLTIEEIKRLPKGKRLQQFRNMFPKQYGQANLILIDDEPGHVSSCRSMENMWGIFATTRKGHIDALISQPNLQHFDPTDFYEVTIKLLINLYEQIQVSSTARIMQSIAPESAVAAVEQRSESRKDEVEPESNVKGKGVSLFDDSPDAYLSADSQSREADTSPDIC